LAKNHAFWQPVSNSKTNCSKAMMKNTGFFKNPADKKSFQKNMK